MAREGYAWSKSTGGEELLSPAAGAAIILMRTPGRLSQLQLGPVLGHLMNFTFTNNSDVTDDLESTSWNK